MIDYPKDLMGTATGVTSYVLDPPARPTLSGEQQEAWDAKWPPAQAAYLAVQLRPSPVDKIVGAFEVLRLVVDDLDEAGLAVLTSCCEQIMINGFHQKTTEAMTVRDAAIALMP